MVELRDVYRVISAILPLYAAIGLGYGSMRIWKIMDEQNCVAVNRYVSTIALPFLCFQLVAQTDIYKVNVSLLAADTVSKVVVLICLAVWALWYPFLPRSPATPLKPNGWAYDWALTLFMVSGLPNTLVIGIPVLGSMYGSLAESLMAQLVVLQTVLWFSILMVLLELRGARHESHTIMALRMESVQDVNSAESQPPTEGLAQEDEPPDVRGTESTISLPSERGSGAAAPPVRALSSTERRTMARLTIRILLKKLAKNLILWSALLGVIYSLLSFGIGFGYPLIIKNTVGIVGQTGLGMAMFSLGLFIAQQSNGWMPCGVSVTLWTAALRFLLTPVIMAALSAMFGLQGDILRIAIVQAALPQGIAPFVFAQEYKVNPQVLSTGVVLGTLASLPILLTYFILLGL